MGSANTTRPTPTAIEDGRDPTQYLGLFHGGPDGMLVHDATGVILDANEAMARVLGCTVAELRGRCLPEIVAPRASEGVREPLPDQPRVFEAAFRSATGATTPVEIHQRRVPWSDGHALLSVSRDITGRKRIEEALRASGEQYQALFEQSIDGIYLHDLEGRNIDVNKAALTQSRFSKDELLRMTVFDFIVGEIPRDEITRQWREWRPSEAVMVEAHHRRKDGTVYPVEISTGKIHFGDKELMLAIVRDITERKRAEHERDRLEAQLRHAQKMEAIGRLAGGVAHDFNNMLCAISGNAELALGRLPAGDRLREPIEAVVAAAARAADLTRQLLAFSRKQVTEPRVIDLNHLLESLHPMLARLLGEDVELRTVAGEGLGRVRVDPSQIEQVVLNLAVNARDAMPEGGELVVETRDVSLDRDCCAAHGSLTPGPYVLLAVSDTGVGMDAATRSKIFEPFFTTKETGKGTGLGLATVYGIVEQSGGRIEVYSEPGHGTSFKVYFPRILDAADALVRRASPAPRVGNETVLVVEDEPMVRDVAVRFLERCGYEVLAAASATGAFDLAQSWNGPIDLLLTDVVMAHVNGHELARRLAALRPGLKVLYASGYTENVIVHRGIVDPGVHFIAKPYSFDALSARVREVLDGQGEGDGGRQRE